MNLIIIKHSGEHLRLFLDVLIILSRESNIDISKFQIYVGFQGVGDMQNQSQKLFFRKLESCFGILCASFGRRPTVTEYNRASCITGGTATVPVGHTTDGEDSIIAIVNHRLGLSLIKFLGDIVRVTIGGKLQSAHCYKLTIFILFNIRTFYYKQRLNELLNAVHSVRSYHIKLVEKREDDLKSAQPSHVCRVLNNRHPSKHMIFCFLYLVIFNLIVLAIGINAVTNSPVLLMKYHTSHETTLTEFARIYNESIARVESVNLKRGLVLFAHGVGKCDTVACSAYGEPFGEFFVLRRFIFRKNKLVEFIYVLKNFLFTSVNILDRCPHEIRNLESDDLIRSVLYDNVIDFRANFFCSVYDWLFALIVAIEIINIHAVLVMKNQCLIKHISYINIGDFSLIGVDNTTTCQALKCYRAHRKHLLLSNFNCTPYIVFCQDIYTIYRV